MQFAQGDMLNLLWAVVPLGMAFYWAVLRHRAAMNKFAEAHLIKEIAASFNEKKLIWKYILLILVFIFSVLALARPQWGFEWQEVQRKGLDILVAIDTSKSMLTQDVKPNRLQRTKLAVKDLLKKLKGDRVGLIAFAGDAYLMCPLTVDYNGFLLSLNDLNAGTVPRGGTNISSAIEEAIKSYDDIPTQYKAAVIITDGEDLEGDSLVAAKKAKQKGIKIYTIGIGTREGELIQVDDEKGQKVFMKDQGGNFVKSRLNERLLQQIALTTNGVYVQSSGAQFGLDLIYDKELSKIEKRQFEGSKEKKYYERFQFPLAIALLLLVIESCIFTRQKN